jgi:hypothetical protein
MILYGGLLNQFNVIYGGTPFTIYGGIKKQLTKEGATWPIYGAMHVIKSAPTHILVYGATTCSLVSPTHKMWLGAVRQTTAIGVNISGLSISAIPKSLYFETPAYMYNIYPYRVSDVSAILGTTELYTITDSTIIFQTIPAGPIRIILFNRLLLMADEIKQLEVINTISNRVEFTDIQVGGNFTFSLNATGPWSNPLTVTDFFYIKAPSMSIDGSDFTKDITVSAKVFPRG